MKKITKQTTISDYLIFYLAKEKKYIKESTYAIYSAYVHNKIIPYYEEYKINHLNTESFQGVILYLITNGNVKTGEGLCHRTVNSIATFFKGAIEYLFKENILKSFDTSTKMIKSKASTTIKILSDLEVIRIRDHLKQNSTPRNLGILIAMYSGLRIGELCALTWNDLDLDNNTINITKTMQRITIIEKDKRTSKIIITTPKSTKSKRSIPISNELIDILRACTNKTGYILSNSEVIIEPRSIRYHYCAQLKKLAIPNKTFHCLRHTFATRLISSTKDFKTVSELLGHSSIAITLDTYTHTTQETKINCINNF